MKMGVIHFAAASDWKGLRELGDRPAGSAEDTDRNLTVWCLSFLFAHTVSPSDGTCWAFAGKQYSSDPAVKVEILFY